MSATDELRKLLDERGVEYKSHYLNTSWYAGMKLYMATDDMDGTLTVDNLTPEQAVAATLGSGTLTAAQVREAIMSADRWEKPMGNTGLTNTHLIIRDDGWQAIADELNSRTERTCKIESSYYYDDYDLYEFEFSCGHSVNMYDKEPTNYCPICGCKVVSE